MSDLRYVSRGFIAGALEFQFRCDSEQTVETYESIFRDLSKCDDPVVDIEVSHRRRQAFVRRPGGTRSSVPREDLVPWETLRQINLAALDADPERIHVHAAALELSGHGAIIVAPSGTGKTTMAALLSQMGGIYATDEMVGFCGSEAQPNSFPKPFSIKEDHHETVEVIATVGHQVPVGSRRLSIVPASLIGAIGELPLIIDLIVFLTRSNDDRASVAPVHPANATAELALQSMDLERAGATGLATLATVASRATCVAVSAGSPKETAALIHQFAASLPPRTAIPPPMVSRDGQPSIHWIEFGDAIAFYAQQSGSVGSLHEPHASEWRSSNSKSERLLGRLAADAISARS